MLLHDPTDKMGTCKPLPDQVVLLNQRMRYDSMSNLILNKKELSLVLKLDNKEIKLFFIYYCDNYMHMPLLLLEILIASRL